MNFNELGKKIKENPGVNQYLVDQVFNDFESIMDKMRRDLVNSYHIIAALYELDKFQELPFSSVALFAKVKQEARLSTLDFLSGQLEIMRSIFEDDINTGAFMVRATKEAEIRAAVISAKEVEA